MPKIQPDVEAFARIKVIGIGGSGTNAVNHMVRANVKGVEFISVNTDAQDLHHSPTKKKVHIGKNLTRGLGAGMDPDLGKRAAEETIEEIQSITKGADMVFITCGMGGGTGSGASPIVAKKAHELGALTVGVVTKPFFFEGTQRMRIAEEGIANLSREVDALITIPNDRLLATVQKETTAVEAFAMCDDILRRAVEGISDLITTPGIINVDFADIKAILKDAGSALMGIGFGTGEKRAEEAARSAINSPLLDLSITGAKGVLFAIAGGEDLTLNEINEAAKTITESIDNDAKVIFGAVKDDKLKKDEVKVTVIASGFPENGTAKATSLFSSAGVATAKKDGGHTDTPTTPIRKSFGDDTARGINNSLITPTEKVPEKKSSEKTIDEAGDDDWAAIPAFLRRKKD
ncbi:MAG: cell division protein FtsZ [Candidatus Lloydbacteria bacterium CG22_combo_CG10-13_8_21_14_all_47_15]|uniref:Cell division protein FtsZ n=1 Tax=Candidatus Lloydbacteria bacterium CG22_combo_CG10-13_8_21_14_all_47_15 TaxID=1974635 RepID=A0A2H0CW21_9BACT|nr:MAG: cell division protein FtsZ [Candidatus Lloydbacteria bacterium CG22_combo_CG10-13_8_21_14_all_47_15]